MDCSVEYTVIAVAHVNRVYIHVHVLLRYSNFLVGLISVKLALACPNYTLATQVQGQHLFKSLIKRGHMPSAKILGEGDNHLVRVMEANL